jgi:hypothetical protein
MLLKLSTKKKKQIIRRKCNFTKIHIWLKKKNDKYMINSRINMHSNLLCHFLILEISCLSF